MSRRFAPFLLTAAILLAGVTQALAGICDRTVLSAEVLSSWSNPQPDPSDVVMPIPGGMSIVFTPVPLGGEGLYDGPIYKMGSEQAQSFAFETPLDVRVGSAIVDNSQKAILLMGKYELSKGQYAMIMGNGDIARGLQAMRLKWGDSARSQEILAPYLEQGPCFQIVTASIVDLLAEPITFLSYGDYTEVINILNNYCIQRLACQSLLTGLGRNPDFPGFVRLPTEHEWEFVARGGLAFMNGQLTKAALQADVPFIEPGKSLTTYAHVDNEPARLAAIGSRQKWFGFYDMLGNAEELMQNPFTAENGFGAVGAYVARGGNYRLSTADIRVSKRVELSLFRRDDQTGQFSTQYFPLTGIRLAVGLPVVSSLARTGDSFDPDAYVPIDEAGDIAGNSINEARALGPLVSAKPTLANDEVSSNDLLDFYTFELREFGTVQLSVTVERPVKIRVADDSDHVYLETALTASTPANQPLLLEQLLPQKYVLTIEPGDKSSQDNKYRMSITRELQSDTGIERPSTKDLANAIDVTTGKTIKSGFVGSGDRSDFYPVTAKSGLGAISVAVTGHAAPVTISYLNERQQLVGQVNGTAADSSIELIVPAAMGSRGFVQIQADTTSSTLYKMEMQATSLYDSIFAARMANATTPAARAKSYAGYVSPSAQMLYMRVRLVEPKKLRAELSGLSADVDLTVMDANGARIESNSARTGVQPEFAELNLQPGIYFIQALLKDRTTPSKFTLYYDLLPYSGKGQVADPAAARAAARQLVAPTRDGNFMTLTSKADAQYFAFNTSEARTMLTIDIGGFSASTDLDLYLENSSGAVMAKSNNVGSAAETIDYTVTPGRYFVRVQPSGTSAGGTYFLSLLGFGAMGEPDMSWMGTRVEQIGDYEIYKKDTRCYLVTSASKVTPEVGWLRTRPVFYAGVETGNSSVWISLLEAKQNGGVDIIAPGTVSVNVIGSNGRKQNQPALFKTDETDLKPIVPRGPRCSSDYCVSNDTIVSFVRGNSLEIMGRTAKSNESAIITYSLTGYTRSARRINELCKADASWIFGR